MTTPDVEAPQGGDRAAQEKRQPEAWSQHFTTLLAGWRRTLCRLIDPTGFFNPDASLEIDRLTVEVETLREQLADAQRVVMRALA